MHIIQKMKQLEGACRVGYWADRAYAELCYLLSLSSTKDGIWDARIDAACDKLLACLGQKGRAEREDVLALENDFADLGAEAKKLTVHCVAHAHIDMNWQWGYQETAAVTIETFRTMLALMEEYPDFKFSQSQAATYEIVEKFAPEMLGVIRRRIKEGRWEVSASHWVENDQNLPNGESLCRQILYAKRYLGNLLRIDPDSLDLDFAPDTFGHSANIPEICAAGGIRYYYMTRAYDEHPDLFRWRAASGHEVIVFREAKAYNGAIENRSFMNIPRLCEKNGTDCHLFVYGVGDHGGGPTRRDIERLTDVAAFPLYPKILFSTYRAFFTAAEKFRGNFPVVDHENNYVYTGCFSSQSRLKMANRIAEDRAADAEALTVSANLLASAAPRTDTFGTAWKQILFNQFHDILPGSGTVETREYAMGRFQEALAGFDIAANTAMRQIADRIDTSSIPFEDDRSSTAEGAGVGLNVAEVDGFGFPHAERGRGSVRAFHVFNPTAYDRDEVTELTVWDYGYDQKLAYFTDAEGEKLPFEILSSGNAWSRHSFIKYLVRVRVPAFGYTTCILRLGEHDDLGEISWIETGGQCDYIADLPYILENGKIRMVFDPTTVALTEFVDKVTGKHWVTPDRPSALFCFVKENPRYGMTAWRVGPYMQVDVLNGEGHPVRVIDYATTTNRKWEKFRAEVDGLRKWLTYQMSFGSSTVTVTAELRGESDTVRFHVDADWREIGGGDVPQLQFRLPVAEKIDSYTYDVPMGLLTRGDIPHDVPGNSCMRLGSAGRAPFIVAATKCGFRGHDDTGSLTLIRATTEPDRYPEVGTHHFDFGVGICDLSEQKREATLFSHPLPFCAATNNGRNRERLAEVSGAETGALPLTGKAFSLAVCGEDGNERPVCGEWMVSALKNAEDVPDALILRVVGLTDTDLTARLTLSDLSLHGRKVKRAVPVDLTERHETGTPLPVTDGRAVTFPVPAHGIVTLKIQF